MTDPIPLSLEKTKEAPRFCVDCRFHYPSPTGPTFAKCRATFDLNSPEYLVSGEEERAMSYCSVARMPAMPCGPGGTLFARKEAYADQTK